MEIQASHLAKYEHVSTLGEIPRQMSVLYHGRKKISMHKAGFFMVIFGKTRLFRPADCIRLPDHGHTHGRGGRQNAKHFLGMPSDDMPASGGERALL